MWLGGGINIPTNQPTKLLFLYPLGWELNVLYGLVGKWKILRRIRESEKRTLKEVNLWPENVIFWERKEEPKSSSLLNNNRG